MRTLLALTLAAMLTGCTVVPGCWVMISIPTFIPSVGCGIDFAPHDKDGDDSEDEEGDDV